MKKLLLITHLSDLSLPLYLTQNIQKRVFVDFFFFHENPSDLEHKLLKNNYDYIYFGYPFRILKKESIQYILNILLDNKKNAYIIDHLQGMNDIYFEDKWKQYQIYSEFMPKTELLNVNSKVDFETSIVKERISGRTQGVFFDASEFIYQPNTYITQEKIQTNKEYRVYAVCNDIMPTIAIRTPKTPISKIKVVGTETISPKLTSFVQNITEKNTFDLIGLDIVVDASKFYLIEINRACLFNAYFHHSGINLAEVLLNKLNKGY